MLHFKHSPRTHIDDGHDGDLAFWARVLDEHPEQIRRAVRTAGSHVEAVRSFLATRQLGLDFGDTAAQFAASRAPGSR